MKKIFIALFLLVAFGTYSFAQVEEAEKKATYIMDEDGNLIETTDPVMEFDLEKHDFGEVEEGPKIEYQFKFTNVGKEPLIISNVKASCGCTTPEWPKEPIMPGEESFIKAVYNTKGRPGPFNKSITITSNAHTPTKRLFIKGAVKKPEQIQTQPVKKEKSIMLEDAGK